MESRKLSHNVCAKLKQFDSRLTMGLFKRFVEKVIGNKSVNDSDWEDLSLELLQSDLGRELADELIAAGKKSKETPIDAITAKLNEVLSKKDRATKSGVILIVGVNGSGNDARNDQAHRVAKHGHHNQQNDLRFVGLEQSEEAWP